MNRVFATWPAVLPVCLGLLPFGFFPAEQELDGSCPREPDTVVDCRARGFGAEPVPAGLVGPSWTGALRPDPAATYIDDVPRGQLWADRGPLGDTGRRGYGST